MNINVKALIGLHGHTIDGLFGKNVSRYNSAELSCNAEE